MHVLHRPVELTAGDCLLPQLCEGLLWRKRPLKPEYSAAIADPMRLFDFDHVSLTMRPGTLEVVTR